MIVGNTFKGRTKLSFTSVFLCLQVDFKKPHLGSSHTHTTAAFQIEPQITQFQFEMDPNQVGALKNPNTEAC